MAEVAWKRSEVGVPVQYSGRHFLPLSPLLRGIVTGPSDLQAVLLQQRLRLPAKILPRNACQGQELSSPEVLKSFPAECLRGEMSVPEEKLLGKCIQAFSGGFLGTVVSPSLWAGVRGSCECCGGAVPPFPCFPVLCQSHKLVFSISSKWIEFEF